MEGVENKIKNKEGGMQVLKIIVIESESVLVLLKPKVRDFISVGLFVPTQT